jgi:hypothetical protein
MDIKYKKAQLSEALLHKLHELEHFLQDETNQDIVLIPFEKDDRQLKKTHLSEELLKKLTEFQEVLRYATNREIVVVPFVANHE